MSATSPAPTILNATLPNGLGVILRESHDAPVASFWVWYRVGSRHELPGLTGLSHWVEHMQFKGTASLGKGQIFSEVSRNGGMNNAMTSNDWTAYYETLPADRLELAIRIEADRMSNSLFDPAETESERTVILSERQGAENNPGYLLYEEVVGTAFRAHPYRHMVIGYESDLKQIGRDDLFGHYRRHYRPGNAFIVATGDFNAEALLETIERAFGGTAPDALPTPPAVAEPPHLGERRVTLRRPSPTSYLRVGYRSPAG
ncbi:MAG: M16 family metallopeptidase, partial [Thermomicrobiales bacterium]